ncbi:hypothetical protein GBA52_024552, partial [Prunus armeniaca]
IRSRGLRHFESSCQPKQNRWRHQKAIGAKIRIEEAQVKSLDRVVVVVASSAICSKIWLRTLGLKNVNGGGEEEIEVGWFRARFWLRQRRSGR